VSCSACTGGSVPLVAVQKVGVPEEVTAESGCPGGSDRRKCYRNGRQMAAWLGLLSVAIIWRSSYNVAQDIFMENAIMSANAVVRARIDEKTKEEATVVLAAMGLTVSDAFRIMLTRVAREKALPFEPLVPNEETIEAMKEARRGGLKSAGSVDELMTDLHADD
jgi:DNA-damage-inducible protein J